MDEQSQKAIPPPTKAAIEYKPTYKDPPLNPISPGNGMLAQKNGHSGLGSHNVKMSGLSHTGNVLLSHYQRIKKDTLKNK